MNCELPETYSRGIRSPFPGYLSSNRDRIVREFVTMRFARTHFLALRFPVDLRRQPHPLKLQAPLSTGQTGPKPNARAFRGSRSKCSPTPIRQSNERMKTDYYFRPTGILTTSGGLPGAADRVSCTVVIIARARPPRANTRARAHTGPFVSVQFRRRSTMDELTAMGKRLEYQLPDETDFLGCGRRGTRRPMALIGKIRELLTSPRAGANRP
jgi:hypothetical protein